MFIRSKEDYQFVQLQHKLETLARTFRKNATPAESRMWEFLRNRKLAGLKFRRQHPLFHYIVDFYCHEYKLVVEIDGPIHEYQLPRDQSRDQFLRDHGYHIIRFINQEVFEQTEKILHTICSLVPSPTGGEGRSELQLGSG